MLSTCSLHSYNIVDNSSIESTLESTFLCLEVSKLEIAVIAVEKILPPCCGFIIDSIFFLEAKDCPVFVKDLFLYPFVNIVLFDLSVLRISSCNVRITFFSSSEKKI